MPDDTDFEDFDLDSVGGNSENENFAKVRRYAKSQERLAKDQARENAELKDQMKAFLESARESVRQKHQLGDEEWAELQSLAPNADPAALDKLASRLAPKASESTPETPPATPPVTPRTDAFTPQTGDFQPPVDDEMWSYEKYREKVTKGDSHEEAVRMRLANRVKPPLKHLDADGEDKYKSLYPRPQDPGYDEAGGWARGR